MEHKHKVSGVCLVCDNPVPEKRLRMGAKFCSPECARERARSVYRHSNPKSILSTGKVGAISELVVSVDLMNRGYDVFRAVSQACSCDLLARHPIAGIISVEVRTGKRSASGNLQYAKNNIRATFLAVVCGQDISYIPDLPGIN